ncbi:hypothetical protein D2N39_13030 [Gemmobacter lutimaris]|uniref:Uncharacterized protein n=1 Tax=Gemmobacter lutimaris TaxID=2306023 RepID=A0A398BPH4_9RHOB|nr:hypothetical protein D2N39_13030 [Gemmobacter lutimaris]
MAETVLLPGMRRRFLKFDARTMALKICPLLDRGDRAGAVAVWDEARARAHRALDRHGVSPAARAALIRALSTEIRDEIIRERGCAALGPVAPDQRPAPTRPSAAVLQFRKAGGAA